MFHNIDYICIPKQNNRNFAELIIKLSLTMTCNRFMITNRKLLEKAALHYGMLPFFANKIEGFSIEEMAAPGMLFGGSHGEAGCWEWKGPVIQEQTTAYGKFFNRKAGFVSLELLPDFLNYRREAYPIKADSPEQMILELIRTNGGLTSSELRKLIFGSPSRKRKPEDLVGAVECVKPKRHVLEAPLQRLQMGGRLLIADFEYKLTSRGERYGWGVALYATPEMWFDNLTMTDRTPAKSFEFLVNSLSAKLPGVNRKQIIDLIK